MKQKILLDTDLGSDIDDSVALAYLLSKPECELLGITTVTGDTEQRARMASALCIAAGQPDIPIYPGAEQTLLIEQKQPAVPQAAALARWQHRTDFPKGEAVEFLRCTIRAHPGEVTLLTIGPLTNAALLFRVDPEIPALLKGLVMMVGLFGNKAAGYSPLEWNALVDPHATAIVYQTPVAQHRSIGLDVTTRVTMTKDEVRARFTAPLLRPVLDFADVWFQHTGGITYHDPLAAAVVFRPEICTFTRGTVQVELTSPALAGYNHWRADPNGPHEVALEVDKQAFFAEYFSVF